ncbi:ATP-binding protein [Embleya sp. NPDC059237]|uniref:ATP-binding protein n=1 Tax=Embleya sp. NPDC059237 TaxID=3346784 RepID=UPI0036B80568
MTGFIGRQPQLRQLDKMLRRVERQAGPGGRPGTALLMRGRRRVGKSRLVEEFVDRAGVPSVFFTASTRTTREEIDLFVAEAAASDLPGAALFTGAHPDGWDAALRLLAAALPADGPSIVVFDEMPYLIEKDAAFEGTLQKLFDRELSRKPVLLIGIGSDLAMMEAMGTYGRPFYQRATEMVVPQLNPREVAVMLDLPAAEAFDAYLATGGLPLLCAEWEPGTDTAGYLATCLADPLSALVVSGERSLAAEFPTEAQARRVLEAIGSGERTFTNIARAAGDIAGASLTRALTLLTHKRIVAAETPLSTKPANKDTRYRVTDPHLRLWLAFVGPHLAEIERGRGDRANRRLRTSWSSWRGRAVEPVIREALALLPPERLPPGCEAFGGYWTRTNDPEIDIVAADRAPIAKHVTAVGSIKWLEGPFDHRDLTALTVHRDRLPGAGPDTPLIAASRSGTTTQGIDYTYGPQDLLTAWE